MPKYSTYILKRKEAMAKYFNYIRLSTIYWRIYVKIAEIFRLLISKTKNILNAAEISTKFKCLNNKNVY